jgi:hypothetical protein
MKVNLIPRKNLSILSAAFCTVMFAFSHNASATRHPLPPVITASTPIEGTIQFGGSAHFDTNSLLTATTVMSWINTHVEDGATGDFSGLLMNTPATFGAPWVFTTPKLGLWSVGGFTFDLLSATVVTQTAKTLTVEGTGKVSANGFDPTAMAWSFTTQSAGGITRTSFSFSANNAAVPDGGSTVSLLGLALIGIEVLRRKRKAA